MGLAAATWWEVLEKTSNVAQMFAVLVAVLTTLLRVHRSNRRECARLERCTRRLRALLQWPATGGVSPLLCSETGVPFGEALADAAGLVESYKNSTLWRRVWSGSTMATRLRDMQDVVDSYSGLLLFVNAHLLLQQQQQAVHRHHPIPPSSDTTSSTIPEVNDDTSQSPSTEAGTSGSLAVRGTRDAQRANDDVGQGGTNTDAAGAGCQRNVPALLPIYSDFPCITVHA